MNSIPSRYEAARDPQAAAIRARESAARRESYNRRRAARPSLPVTRVLRWAGVALALAVAFSFIRPMLGA